MDEETKTEYEYKIELYKQSLKYENKYLDTMTGLYQETIKLHLTNNINYMNVKIYLGFQNQMSEYVDEDDEFVFEIYIEVIGASTIKHFTLYKGDKPHDPWEKVDMIYIMDLLSNLEYSKRSNTFLYVPKQDKFFTSLPSEFFWDNFDPETMDTFKLKGGDIFNSAECCVCNDRTQRRTNCWHSLCGACQFNLHKEIKNCPICRNPLDRTKNSRY